VADGIESAQTVSVPSSERFIAIAVAVAGDHKNGVVLYYAAVDRVGRAWWWDTKQPTEEWQPLPPHPESLLPPTSGSEP
jgi:hypothetical protein